MTMNIKKSLLLTLICLATAQLSAAEPKKEEPTFLDPKDAGPDYVAQGEYVGAVGDERVGVQVIALGDGKFHGVLYHGGLPGAGWDGGEKIEGDGATEGEKVIFRGKDGEGIVELAAGKITGKTGDGKAILIEKTLRESPTAGAKPPKNAIVLFDGSNADEWTNAHMDERHLLQAGTKSKRAFQDYTLHVEFYLPFKPFSRGQGRANSGVYMQDRYEIQVLDSFGLKGLNNECGGVYTKAAPSVNMCFPPLTWQTYDIDFTAARYGADGTKTKNAIVTVRQNGVMIQDHTEIDGPTGGGQKEKPTPGPIQLQGHGNPVFFRNVWIVENPAP
jgi:hypothetical protein